MSAKFTSSASLPLRYPPSLLPLSAALSPLPCPPDLRLYPARHPQRPRRLPGHTHTYSRWGGKISWGTTRGRKEHLTGAKLPVALQHLTYYPVCSLLFSFLCFFFPPEENTFCLSSVETCEKSVRILNLDKLRPSENNQRTGHTQRDR